LLSDSHGRDQITARAVKLLVEAGAEVLLHLGDLGSTGVVEALVEGLDPEGRPRPAVHIVFGNTDWETGDLRRSAEHLGIAVDDPVGRLVVAARTIVFQHGHHQREMDEALAEEVDYLCHGHTHVARDERIGRTRVINPGALHRARQHTVALLEVPRDRLRFLTVPPPA
jgi:putative phosphoesterase